MEITEDGTLVEKEMSFQTRDMLQARLAKSASPEDLNTDIIAMLSPEAERVNLGKVIMKICLVSCVEILVNAFDQWPLVTEPVKSWGSFCASAKGLLALSLIILQQ